MMKPRSRHTSLWLTNTNRMANGEYFINQHWQQVRMHKEISVDRLPKGRSHQSWQLFLTVTIETSQQIWGTEPYLQTLHGPTTKRLTDQRLLPPLQSPVLTRLSWSATIAQPGSLNTVHGTIVATTIATTRPPCIHRVNQCVWMLV